MRIAVIIPTYNRNEIIEDFFDNYYSYFNKEIFDFYIFDSSTNNKSYEVIHQYLSEFVNYIRVSDKVHANKKVWDAIKNIDKEIYSYAWIIGDAIRIDAESIARIADVASGNVDFIHISDSNEYTFKEYYDRTQFFCDWAWHVTMFGASLVNTSSVLCNVNWKELEEKYCIDGCICYSHVALYFERMSVLDKLRIVYLGNITIWYTELRNNSMWYANTFDIYCNDWLNTIHKLPNIYDDYKLKVIKDLPQKSIITSRYDLLKMRADGVLNRNIYNQYKNELEELLVYNAEDLREIVDYRGTINGYIINRCKKILSRNEIESIWLYGSGKYSRIFKEVLNKCNVNVIGFVESNVKTDVLMDIPVVSIEEFAVKYAADNMIALAVGKKNRFSVIKNMQKNKVCEYFQDSEIDEYIYGLMRDGIEYLYEVIE